MEQLKKSMKSLIVIILAVITALMLPCKFYYDDTMIEYMKDGEAQGIMLWIYCISFALMTIFAILQQKNAAVMLGIVNVGIIAAWVVLAFIYQGRWMLQYTNIGIWVCLATSSGALATLLKVED